MANRFIEQFKKSNPGIPVPANIGKAWTPIEESKLLTNIQNGLSHLEIATLHGRTEGGIKSRLRSIAYDYYTKGMDITTIMNQTGLTENEIQDKIQKQNSTQSPSKPIVDNSVIQLKLKGYSISDIAYKSNLQEFEVKQIIEKEEARKEYIEIMAPVSKNSKKSIEKVTLNLETYNELLLSRSVQESIQKDITDIKNELKQIFKLLQQLELA